jgi:hypothetical protein
VLALYLALILQQEVLALYRVREVALDKLVLAEPCFREVAALVAALPEEGGREVTCPLLEGEGYHTDLHPTSQSFDGLEAAQALPEFLEPLHDWVLRVQVLRVQGHQFLQRV